MNDFDQRWQTLAQQARQAPHTPAEIPFGLTTRVLARSREMAAEPLEDILSVVGLRALLVTAGLFLLTAGFAFTEWYEFRMETPVLDLTVTSELSWP